MDVVFCNEQEAEALCQVRAAERRSLLLLVRIKRHVWHVLGTAPGRHAPLSAQLVLLVGRLSVCSCAPRS